MTSTPHEFRKRIQESADVFIDQMQLSQGQAIEISYWDYFWAFDVTFALIFGHNYGYMKARSDFNGWLHTFKIIIEGRIEKHDQGSHECGKTFMCKTLAGRTSKNDVREHAEAVNILFEAFFAATVDVAVTLGTVFYCLMTNRDAYTRLVGDLRVTCGSKQSGTSTTYQSTLLAVIIKESLRLYPSNSPPMERVVPLSSLQINNYKIPPKTIVGIPQYAAHRDTDVYGDDAEDFRPKRWLEADVRTLRKMDQNFIAFGRGPGRVLAES
ncbi:cytochrome P450 [Dendryphion nanum]|uniref:Cytochrome P450 n=1 Tax=Dendryphion nanum TaxID=256645 RepID=A0A9P9EFU2_9PLEO|nr:cytochrome P450 [Dendryphion nanum]